MTGLTTADCGQVNDVFLKAVDNDSR